jgi:hypothetical protein
VRGWEPVNQETIKHSTDNPAKRLATKTKNCLTNPAKHLARKTEKDTQKTEN